MGVIKQINIKNRTCYFYSDIIDLKNFDARLLKVDKNHTKTLVFTTLDTSQLNLRIDHANGYTEEKNGNKYLIFDSTDENKELLKKHNDVWNGIRDKIKEISSGECDYEKLMIMKIKCNSDDDLPLNKPLKFHNMTITIRSVFEEDGKLYPQVFLDDTLYELNL